MRHAAQLMRSRAKAAREVGPERWVADQNGAGGLIVGAFAPGDERGGVSTSVVASFRHAADALPMASHIAGFDPVVGLAVADWLEATAGWWGQESTFSLGQLALHVARTFLREQEPREQHAHR